MLISHTEFLSRVSIPAAKRLLADFLKSTEALSVNPFYCPFADEIDVPGIPPETVLLYN
jgi:hypothetical protein